MFMFVVSVHTIPLQVNHSVVNFSSALIRDFGRN